MYAKYGRIHKARELFDKIHDVNIVSLITIIGGYAIHGYNKDALKIFDMIKHLEVNHNNITFVCILLVYSHIDLLDEGYK